MLSHFYLSKQGVSHKKNDIVCQDYSFSESFFSDKLDKEFVITAIADGVGSCEFSDMGSKKAVHTVVETIKTSLSEYIDELNDENILDILQVAFKKALQEVEKLADEEELPFSEFDSTLTVTIYDGENLWFGHIGDDGVVALYTDGTYELITKRHSGLESHSLYPLRVENLWQFGRTQKPVASFVLMTDGVLDFCVNKEKLNNRVFFPFLEPALTTVMDSEEIVEKEKEDWLHFFEHPEEYPIMPFDGHVTDDITFVVVQNSESVQNLPEIIFDYELWKKQSELILLGKSLEDLETEELLEEFSEDIEETCEEENTTSIDEEPAKEVEKSEDKETEESEDEMIEEDKEILSDKTSEETTSNEFEENEPRIENSGEA